MPKPQGFWRCLWSSPQPARTPRSRPVDRTAAANRPCQIGDGEWEVADVGTRRWTWALAAVLAVLVAVGLFSLGRHSSGTTTDDSGYQAGHSAGYLEGLTAGQAQGRQEGRALQEGVALPADSRQPVQDAFTAGYTAGANDVFGQYDGGWYLSTPYVITVEQGSAPIAYRIGSRTALQPGIDYYLCPDGHGLCQQSRP